MNMEQLTKIFDEIDKKKFELLKPLMEETIFLKNHLDFLKTLPLIEVNPNNPKQQRKTEAGKMLKDYMQAFNVNMKILLSALGIKEEQDMGNEILKAFAEKLKNNK